MENTQRKNVVYIMSGPAGVGKSTTSRDLVQKLYRSAYLSGDYISHMYIKGRKKPWESEVERSLIWKNILSLTKNFINYRNDVVVDYVTFPQEAKWLCEHLKELSVEVKYIVLWTDSETLVNRDNQRKPEDRMGERSLILMNEFIDSGIDQNHLLDTTRHTAKDIHYVIDEIINDPRFRLN
jgi:adenylate kinase family enzyme